MDKTKTNKEYNERVVLGSDGTYRWRYERSIYTHPDELPAVLKAFGIIALVMYIIMTFITASDGFDEWWSLTWHFLLALPIIALVATIGYYIVAWLKGGKYKAVFDMDENMIVHRQVDWKIKKKDVVGTALILAAAAGGGHLREPAYGIRAESRKVTKTLYKDVVKIQSKRSSNTIYLYERVGKYDVFVNDEDFDIVLNFLQAHCTNIK